MLRLTFYFSEVDVLLDKLFHFVHAAAFRLIVDLCLNYKAISLAVLVFEMLNAAKTSELAVDHYAELCRQRFALFHTLSK